MKSRTLFAAILVCVILVTVTAGAFHVAGASYAPEAAMLSAGADRVWIDPPSISVEEGETFTMTVMVENVQDMVGYEFRLMWDSTVLAVSEVVDAGFLLGDPLQSMQLISDSELAFEAFVPPPYEDGADGDGALAVVTLQAVGRGISKLNLHQVKWYDADNPAEPHTPTVGHADIHADPVPYPPALAEIVNPQHRVSYTLNWSYDGSPEVPDPTSYALQEATDPAFSDPTTYSTTATQLTIQDPAREKVGGTYYYRVRGHNQYGPGPWSTVRSTTVRVVPYAPTLHDIANPGRGDSYTVSWSYAYEYPAVNTFILQEATTPNFSGAVSFSLDASTTSYDFTDKGNQTYYYRVRGRNAYGDGPWSAVRSVVSLSHEIEVYLPLVLQDYVRYFVGPWEVEPNDTWQQANGSLISGRDYYGYPNDERDFFSIYTRKPGQITVNLTGHTGEGVQLQLFQGVPQSDGSNRVQLVHQEPYEIVHHGPAGWYYILIYTESGHNEHTPYTLRLTQ